MKIKVFQYLSKLDAFICTPRFTEIVQTLNLAEWTPAVWIGRLFCMDNDYGEHWHDNWDERGEIEKKARKLGYNSQDLLLVIPKRFQDGKDGPCHSDQLRKAFWTNVLQSLELDFETIVQAALENQEKMERIKHYFDNLSLSKDEIESRADNLRKKFSTEDSGYSFT